MNQETIKLVTAKIEKALETVRVLKSEKADLEAMTDGLRENLQEKDREIGELNANAEQLKAEIRSLQEALSERDEKLNESEGALLQAIKSLNVEFGLEKEEAENRGLF
ncbi:MAG: hypothetical protein LBC85_12130 [Fibromonadaceae bacterium]|jgi:FtsZ-binding cell division protein ZapB|nr:hypothetical protein [Fibromonadaceae bacterium]